MDDCGCGKRKDTLNAFVPGLGDQVTLFLQPIEPALKRLLKEKRSMPELLKPDMKAIVWLAIGAFVVPYILRMVK